MKKSEKFHEDLIAVATAYVDLSVHLNSREPEETCQYFHELVGEAVEVLRNSMIDVTWEYVETLREENRDKKRMPEKSAQVKEEIKVIR